ncbi:MAG TPA: hypothetical protein VM510_09750 [Caulifigura sp.]|jgi:hypothetical protein|nr:hypothetical protein [Caulifigura sp.]
MKRSHLLLVAVLIGLSCGLGSAQERSQEAGMPSDVGELKGKIVALTLLSDPDDLVLLAEVTEKRIGQKSFLRGSGVDDGEIPDWRNGAVVYVPVDDIQQVVAFSDLKAYQKNLESRQNRIEGKAASVRSRRPRST